MSHSACWVIPCYNEAERIDADAFVALVDEAPDIALLFVDDGSLDATPKRLAEMARHRPERIRNAFLAPNRGKGEAVRHGLLEALQSDAAAVGYFDADLATPTSEIRRLTEIMFTHDTDVVLGARVAMLGRRIQRNQLRHYAGRVFASAASVVVGLPVYDTQCGAKLFRRTPILVQALELPFHSRWLFDVELLGRIASASNGVALDQSRMLEEPLREWRDVRGSKLRARDFAIAVFDLTRIAKALRRSHRD